MPPVQERVRGLGWTQGLRTSNHPAGPGHSVRAADCCALLGLGQLPSLPFPWELWLTAAPLLLQRPGWAVEVAVTWAWRAREDLWE